MPSHGEGDGRGRALFALGAVLCGLAVALGAFGTHALEGRFPAGRIATWETGVRYHLAHALALLALGLAQSRWGAAGFGRAGAAIALGIAVFSGSLYALVLTDTPILGAVTPIGGAFLLLGWGIAAWTALRPSPPLPPSPGSSA